MQFICNPKRFVIKEIRTKITLLQNYEKYFDYFNLKRNFVIKNQK